MKQLKAVYFFAKRHAWCRFFHKPWKELTGGDGKRYTVCGGTGKDFPHSCYLYRKV